LIVSYYFYFNTKPIYALLLAGVTLTTYVFTNAIDKTKSQRGKKTLLIVDIIVTLLPLFFFKYYNFVNDGIYALLKYAGLSLPLPNINLLLPIGISFYTFMALGYAIDVYNEEIKAEKNLGIVALFLAFFPLILSGPIERATNMLHQFRSNLEFNYDKAVNGLQLILWGYFMKLVVADRVGNYVHSIFGNIEYNSGKSLFLGTLLYPIQLYGDLGGYSLIAIGCAKVMGINVMPNFNRPFFATSMSEFWRRWHISLISWLTDYIFTPLSFSLRKYKIWGIVMAIMLTFIISGIWHGASLTFIVWGTLQGIFLSIEAITNRRKKAIVKKYHLSKKGWYIFMSCIFTYLLFAFSTIFDAADSIGDAFLVFKKIFTNFEGPIYYENPTMIIFLLFGIFVLFLVDWNTEYSLDVFPFLKNKSWIARRLFYTSIIILILLIGVFDGGQFIYFQF
jgi:alginate O-acetyltransferase complex protein AlgI